MATTTATHPGAPLRRFRMRTAQGAPRDRAIDSMLALVREGYTFLSTRHRRLGSDVVRLRLLGMPVLSLAGADGAALFYDEERFERAGAIPGPLRATLFGEGGVQMLDGAAHHHRKAMFLSLMTPVRVARLVECAAEEWARRLPRWHGSERIVLFDEMQETLCRAACEWAGIPIDPSDVPARARELGSLVDGFGSLGARHLRARRSRHRLEAWIEDVVGQVRGGRLAVPTGSALHVVSFHRELDGRALDAQVAAVEILNVLRPIVAIATYVAFAARALHDFPEHRARLRAGGADVAERFVLEVRRFYPFTPFLGARVRSAFTYRGCRFRRHQLVLLDVYGIDHDPRIWDRPDAFQPDRFVVREPTVFDYVPQGGGSLESGHRCAGERITIELTKAAVLWLTRAIDYRMPPQDLSFPLSRMPTRPTSGVILSHIRPATVNLA